MGHCGKHVRCAVCPHETDWVSTHRLGAATASRAVVWLIFLTCSRTLDLASSIDTLDVEVVDLERMKFMGLPTLGALEMRILAAERDIVR